MPRIVEEHLEQVHEWIPKRNKHYIIIYLSTFNRGQMQSKKNTGEIAILRKCIIDAY